MSLRITARLDAAGVAAVLDDLLPLNVDLSEEGEPPGERWLWVEKPTRVDFVSGEGLRVATTARLQWKTAGVRIPVTLNALELMMRPRIQEGDPAARLLFVTTVENIELKGMPGFVDRRIATRINEALAAHGDRLGWRYGETLSVAVPMPRSLRPIEAFLLAAERAEVEVFADGVVLQMDLGMRFARRDGDDDDIFAL